jgi:hypothetical protein
MSERVGFPGEALNQAGLNRQHIFNLNDLPAEVTDKLGDISPFRQLILLGHGGRKLWECVQASRITGEHPIDDYVIQTVTRFFTETCPTNAYRIVYPGDTPIGLQQLGKLAGWHHPSPFMVGIDGEWGSWFAYRAAILADTGFLPFQAVHRSSPCPDCTTRPCLTACPASALSGPSFALDKCIAYRRLPDSACRSTCLARTACPVGSEHRYSDAQLHHTYSLSLRMIEQYYPAT